MGKASRRRTDRSGHSRTERAAAAPYAARPFEGLAGETEWVAMREILPAATAPIRLAASAPVGAGQEATVATVLPLAWPAMHRNGGQVFVATQSNTGGGDASRDLAAALLAALAVDEGVPVTEVSPSTTDSPRLQDILEPEPVVATVESGFEFWVGENPLDEQAQESLARANESVLPTARVLEDRSAFWAQIGDRSFVRWVLAADEDLATDGLARLHAGGGSALGEGRLLGAFRACGLLIPVWDVDPAAPAESFAGDLLALATRLEDAIADTGALTSAQRAARAGLVNRQVTLR